MPVRIVGMIGVTPPSSDAALHVIEGGLSPSYLTQFARAHDDAGFDFALVGYTSSSAEGFLVALHAAAHTKQLGYLVAHRPGFVAPTLMARKIATFDSAPYRSGPGSRSRIRTAQRCRARERFARLGQ
jgi:alkanesulfonate monooxygenase